MNSKPRLVPATPATPKAVPQVAPGAAYFEHRAAIDAAIAEAMASGWYVLGTQVQAFEREFARYLGAQDAVGVGNGTDALVLAMRALGVKPGDKVATVSHTAVATVAAIAMAGAVPVLIDISADRYTMDPQHLSDALAMHRVKAVIAVHLYGYSADLAVLAQIARQHGAWLIEDCAQSTGAAWHGQKLGSIGDAAAFSFYPTKNLGAFGDGGMVVARDAVVTARVRSLRQYGWNTERISEIEGVNSRLDELQAAILRVRLPHLDVENARRRQIAAHYDRALQASGLAPPEGLPRTDSVFHQYVLASDQRDALRRQLAEAGVSTAIHYPVPAHLQPAHANALLGPGGLPHTERAAARVFSLPMFAQLTDADVSRVSEALTRLQ